MLFCILIIIGIVVLDQASKLLVVKLLDPTEPFVLIKNVFRFSYLENDGAAFGMLDDHRWVFMLLSVVGILALCIYLWRTIPQNNKLANIALCFVIGGGIGNMVDRVRLGYVIDFIDFYAFPSLWKWVFNVADAFVCIGAGMLILYLVLDIIKDAKAEKAVVQENGENTGEENA